MLNISIDERSADIIRTRGHTLRYRYGAVSVLGLRRVAKAVAPEVGGAENPSTRSGMGGSSPVEVSADPAVIAGTKQTATVASVRASAQPQSEEEGLAHLSLKSAELSPSDDDLDDTVVEMDEASLLEKGPTPNLL